MKHLSAIALIVTLLMICADTPWAQVTIEASDFNWEPGITTTSSSVDEIRVNAGNAGANQHWDFSAIQTYDEGVVHWDYAAGHTGADSFPDANRCRHGTPDPEGGRFLDYYEFDDEHIRILGSVIDFGEPDTAIIVQHDADNPLFTFPLNFGDEWVVGITTEFMGRVSTDYSLLRVDAWGTITDVAGTFDCLRIQEIDCDIDTLEDGFVHYEIYNYIYAWIAPDFGMVVSIRSNDIDGNPDFEWGDFARCTGFGENNVNSQDQPPIPINSQLNPAFPNPFNAQTQLEFNVAQPGIVTITVYDINGKMVSCVVNGYFLNGNYFALFNADHLCSGIYYARFTSGGIDQTRTLLLNR